MEPDTRGLKPRKKRRSFFGLGLTKPTAKPRAEITPTNDLMALLRKDRIRRRLTWPEYAKLLGIHLSTLHKIGTGVHRASEITEAIIRDALDRNPVE